MHWKRGQSSLSTREMKSLAILFLSSATGVVVRSNPCQNNEDVFFPDPEGCKQNCVDSVSREYLFRSARTSCRTFDSPPVPSRPPVRNNFS